MLGIVPILIGLKKLLDLYREHEETAESLEQPPDAGGNGRAVSVAIVTMANGGDNIGIYTPSFAIRSASEIAVIALIFFVMAALWCFRARDGQSSEMGLALWAPLSSCRTDRTRRVDPLSGG